MSKNKNSGTIVGGHYVDTSHLGWWAALIYIGVPVVTFGGMALGWWQ